jgi:hypothetical protein
MKTIFTTIIIYFLISTPISSFDYIPTETPAISIRSQESTPVNEYSRVVELTNGNYLLVWHAKLPQSTYFNILFNVYDSTQNKSIKSYVKVSTATSNQSIFPDACSDGNGGFLIIWEDTDQFSYSKVFMRYYDSSLTAGSIINVKENKGGFSYAIPVIERLTSGNYIAFFTNAGGAWVQIYDSSFTPIGSNLSVQDTSYGGQASSVRALLNGGFILGWYGTKNGTNDAFIKFFNKDGVSTTNEILVNTNNQAGSQDWPKIAVLTNGNVFVTWADSNLNNGDAIGIIIGQDGKPVSNFLSIPASTSGKQGGPKTFSLSWGGFGVIWEENSIQLAVGMQIFDNDGNKIATTKMMNNNYSVSVTYIHAIELLKTGNIMVSWTSELPQSSGDHDVYIQFFYKNDGICKDIQASLGNAMSINVDFSAVPYNRIVLKTLPNQGQLKDDTGTVLALNIFIDKTKVTYFSNAQNSDSFTFASNTVDPPCKVDILNCYKTCLNCFQAGDATNHNCIECNPGLYKLADNTINNCYSISEIPQDYYLSTTYNAIIKCYERCLSCSQKGDSVKNNCLKCLNGFYPLEQDTTQCYSTSNVPQSYYLNTSLGAFVKCYSSCLTCNSKGDSGTHNCLQCLDNYYPLEDNTSQCYPYTEVINGYFFNVETINFTRCYQSCATCKMLGDTNQHICLSCKNNFFPLETDNSMCFSKDDSVLGYYLDFNNNVFRKCYKSCSKCTGPGDIINPNCIECDPTYPSCSGCTKRIYKDNCVDNCPILTTYNPLTQMCFDCEPGELVYNNQCVSTCPDGYIQDSYLCSTCMDKNMYNYKKTCVQSCPDNSKLNTSNNTCEILCVLGYYDIAIDACISCSSVSKLYFQGTCVNSCPENYKQVGNSCQKLINIGKYLI